MVLGERPRWLSSLARRVLAAFPIDAGQPTQERLATFIAQDQAFLRARQRLFRQRLRMESSPWPVPALPTPAALAHWLGVSLRQLDWFADCQEREACSRPGPLCHYTYAWQAKRGRRWRLLEIPRPRLRALQRRLLHDLLDLIPPHPAAHGFRRGHSILTYAALHTRQSMVLRFDLRDFFPSVHGGRIHALFRTAGYPKPVARF